MKKRNKKRAFTLAEVLLTLAIVGIVAALTIPSLINSMNESQYRSGLKKSYSVLSNAARSIMMDNNFNGLCANTDDDCLANYFKAKLNVQKFCPKGTIWGNCWHNDNTIKFYSGNIITEGSPAARAALMLNDGSFVVIRQEYSDCSGAHASTTRCAWLRVDINGFKEPNTFGKDIYNFYLNDTNGLLPYGANDGLSDDCIAGANGYTCGYKYMYK